MRPWDGHVWLMRPLAHTTSCDFLAVSTGSLEVLLKYLGCIKNARLLTFLTKIWSNILQLAAIFHNYDIKLDHVMEHCEPTKQLSWVSSACITRMMDVVIQSQDIQMQIPNFGHDKICRPKTADLAHNVPVAPSINHKSWVYFEATNSVHLRL